MRTLVYTSTTPIPLKLKRPVLLLTYKAVLNDCYSEVTTYTALDYSVFTTSMDAKATSADDTNYGCHIKLKT